MNQGANYRIQYSVIKYIQCTVIVYTVQYTMTVQCLFIVSTQQIHNTWCTTWWLHIIHCNIFVNFNICCIVLSLYSILIMRPINYSCMLVSIILLMQVNFHYVCLPLSVSTIMKRREVDCVSQIGVVRGGLKVHSIQLLTLSQPLKVFWRLLQLIN